MKRIYSDYAYGKGPRDGCWWDETIEAPDWPQLSESQSCDVAIIGGGFTGVSAALHLAEAGISVRLLEEKSPGWGASGRNGGFCCLGGSMIEDTALTRKIGAQAAAAYWQAERDAVAVAEGLINRLGIDVDRHSNGETKLAHRAKDMEKLRRAAEEISGTGIEPQLIEKEDLAAHGMQGPFFGGLTLPIGFGLNPRKYLFGLAGAAQQNGALLHANSGVTDITRHDGRHVLKTATGEVRAEKVIIATNGYSSEDLPDWLHGRYMPAQSNVLVTRPLSENELAAQGWTSDQASYDTRNLLHYFRLMPDRRFLFGMRGGLQSSPQAERRARANTRRDFESMFPAWSHVESPNGWSGMVCIARNRLPFVGAIPGQSEIYAGLAYHGNGVAMGSYAGKLLAELLQGKGAYPEAMKIPLARFPFAPLRRMFMPPIYLARALGDL